MISLISLDYARKALHLDDGDMDIEVVGVWIPAASDMVMNYLKGQAETLVPTDTSGELIDPEDVPPAIKAATAMLVGMLMANRDGDPEKAFERGYLPAPVTAILFPLRDPALA